MAKNEDPFGYQKKLKAAVKKLNTRIAKGDTIPFPIMEGVTHTIVMAEYTDDWGGEAYIHSISKEGKVSRWNYGSNIFKLIWHLVRISIN